MHGDLQFDNVIISDDNKFKVIDWRHEFADMVEIGDIYYDLAKLMGGFIINYSDIKNNNFTVTVDNGDVSLSVPGIEHSDIYIDRLKQFIINKGWSYTKVRTLIPIIFWNMSPLHTPPFDQLLWYLGIKLFEELEL
jgi:thiamine kinase-like enzyme